MKTFSRRDFLKGVLAGSASLAAIGVLGACGSSASDETTTAAAANDTAETTASSGETESAESEYTGSKDLVVGIPGNPDSLSPFISMSTGRMYMLLVCYESLGYFTDSTYSDYKFQLVESYEVNDEMTEYTIHLYDNIYDTDGNHFTADDVVYSWDRINELGGATWSRYASDYYAADETTVVLDLYEDVIDVFTSICRGPVVTQAAYEASADQMTSTCVSTAQYTLSDCTPGSSYGFVRNENYWNDDESTWLWRSIPDTVTYKVILEESQMATSLETGAINVALGMSNTNTDRYVGDPDYNMFENVGNMAYCLIFNNSDGNVFHNNKELRQAVAYSIDVDDLIEAVLGGAGVKLGTYSFCLAGDYKEEWVDNYYNYDVDKAKELIEESGVDVSGLTIRLACGSGSVIEKTAEMVQLYMLAVGFGNVTIQTADTALFTTLKVDSTAWDILLDTKGIQDTAGAATAYDRTVYSYGNMMFLLDDDKLQEMIIPLNTTVGATQDKIDEYVEYTNEMCYLYAMYDSTSYSVTTKDITSITLDFHAAIIPGETEFG